MELPDNWTLFKKNVLNKIEFCCSTNISPIRYEKFSAWLNNFEGDTKSEYIALQILDSLIFRSKDMIQASYSRLLYGEIKTLIFSKIDETHKFQKFKLLSNWKYQLKHGGLSQYLRFSPIITDEPEGESGQVVYRSLSSIIDTKRYALSKNEDAEILILVDDILGSGDQFLEEFAPKFSLEEKLASKLLIIYSPALAYCQGIEAVKKRYPDLYILPAEIIFEANSLFSGSLDSKFRNDQVNTVEVVKEYFQIMQDKYCSSAQSKYWFGYENACLPVVFEWGCPNHAPYILWMDKSPKNPNWKQLFERRA